MNTNKIIEAYKFISKLDKSNSLYFGLNYFYQLGCTNYYTVLKDFKYERDSQLMPIYESTKTKKYSNEEIYKQRENVINKNGISGLELNDDSCVLNQLLENKES